MRLETFGRLHDARVLPPTRKFFTSFRNVHDGDRELSHVHSFLSNSWSLYAQVVLERKYCLTRHLRFAYRESDDVRIHNSTSGYVLPVRVVPNRVIA